MAFTYDGTLDTDLEKVRLVVGDTDSTDPLLTDAEVNHFLGEHSDINVAAAAAAEAIAGKFARGYNFATDGQSFNRSERVDHYLALAARLDPANARNAGGITTTATTRIDGYSEDVDYQDVDTGSVGRIRRGYYDPDLPQ